MNILYLSVFIFSEMHTIQSLRRHDGLKVNPLQLQ